MSKQDLHPEQESPLVLSYCDIKHIFLKRWRIVVWGMILCALLIGGYRLTRPVQYSVSATFREKANASGMETKLLGFLGSPNGSSESVALSWLKSRKLMEILVRQLSLQAVVVQQHSTDSFLGRIKANLQVEYAIFKGREQPGLPERNPEIALRNIDYHQEVSQSISIFFTSEEEFSVFDDHDHEIGRGSLGIPFSLNKNSFTVIRYPHTALANKKFSITLYPLHAVAGELLRQTKVDLEGEGSLLKITSQNSDRHKATLIVNTLMVIYQQHLRDEQARVAQEQIAYLQKRQKEMAAKLQQMLISHAESLSADLGNTGFASSEKAMEFVAATQLEYRRKLNTLEIETRRLRKGLEGEDTSLETFIADNNHPQIAQLVNERRDLRQQADAIKLALNSSPNTSNEEKENDFQGINLQTARELYLTYCKELHQIETSMLQYEHILLQLKDPNFEICSLGTILDDPVSRDMISKASQTALSLKDANNRSNREQDRLKEELLVQKNFLQMHLAQSLQLLTIRYDLVKQKIRDIQHVNLGLIQQQISIMEKHLVDYIISHILSSNQQRDVIVQHQKELHDELKRLPTKWVSEKLIVLEMEANQRMIDEITKLVETKNIGSNLEVVQSAPVDAAIPPLYPNRPFLAFFMFAGAIAGGILTFGGLVIGSIASGLMATPENLIAHGQRVLGTWTSFHREDELSKMHDNDLAILRRMTTFAQETAKAKTLLLLKNGLADFTPALAKLLALQGKKALILPLSFEDQVSEGLLQYLQGAIDQPKIIKEEGYDRIPAGGYSRFAPELIASVRFDQLLDDLRKKYDWILLVSSIEIASPEAVSLIHRFGPAVVEIKYARLEALAPLFRPGTAFVFS